MGIGVSLILIAVGAILTWAVSADVSGVDLQTVGVILMVVGAVGALLSLVVGSGAEKRPSCATANGSSSADPPHRSAVRRRRPRRLRA